MISTSIIEAGLTCDVSLFEKSFSHCLLTYGLMDTYVHILLPVQTRSGLLCSVDTMDPRQAGSWILFLEERENTISGVCSPP